jgi:hypothetical protein
MTETDNEAETTEGVDEQIVTYRLSIAKTIEVDAGSEQLMRLMKQTGKSSGSAALEEVYLQEERERVEAEEKLLSTEINATSDN